MRLPVGELLEAIGVVVLTVAAVGLGTTFHRVALAVTLAAAVVAVGFVYFGQCFQDAMVRVRMPRIRKKKVVNEPGAPISHKVICQVCGDPNRVDHTDCNRAIETSANVMKGERN